MHIGSSASAVGTTVSAGRPGTLVVDRARRSQAQEECDKQYNEAMLGLQQHRLDQIEMEHTSARECAAAWQIL